jgi:hypothetical protein
MKDALREFVCERADDTCEYCRIEGRQCRFSHQIDHIVARKHDGTDDTGNLAWSCVHCNQHKGTDLAGIDPVTKRREGLFDPRADRWSDHFRYMGAVLTGLTPTGRATIAALRINAPDRVAMREDVIFLGEFTAG